MSSSSNAADSDAVSVRDYLLSFRDRLERELPEEQPRNRPIRVRVVGDYVSRADKRLIRLYIQIGATHALRVDYRLPVSAAAAPLFREVGLQPHVEPVFGLVLLSAVQSDAALAGFVSWESELTRISQINHRSARNLVIYWRAMRRRLREMIRDAGVGTGSERRTSTRRSSNKTTSNPTRRSSTRSRRGPTSDPR